MTFHHDFNSIKKSFEKRKPTTSGDSLPKLRIIRRKKTINRNTLNESSVKNFDEERSPATAAYHHRHRMSLDFAPLNLQNEAFKTQANGFAPFTPVI